MVATKYNHLVPAVPRGIALSLVETMNILDFKTLSVGTMLQQALWIDIFEANPNFSSGIGLVYYNGEPCGSGSYTTIVNVACDISAGTGELYDAYKSNECEWTFQYALPFISTPLTSSLGTDQSTDAVYHPKQ